MAAITFGSLLSKVSTHRVNMGYPAVSEGYVSLADEVEDFICNAMSPQDQIGNCQTTIRPMTSIHWRMAWNFLKTMGSWLITGFTIVPQAEAERRATICANCPYNVGLSGCGACRNTLSILRKELIQASTSQDDKLLACGVCGCDNTAQVHVPLDVLRKGTGHLDYPVGWCWKSKGGKNEVV
jgi:hypothetical protein